MKIKPFNYCSLFLKGVVGSFALITYMNFSVENYDKRVVLSILLYMSMSLVFYIVKNKLIKIVCLLISIILILFLALKINYIFIILLSQLIGDMQELNDNIGKLGIVCLMLAGIFMSLDYGTIYYLILMTTYMSLKVIYFYYKENLKLHKEIQSHKIMVKEYGKIIENSKESEKQAIYTSLLEDRNKLAQEMHDKIGHVIAGSIMQLEAAKVLISKDNERSKALLDNSIYVLRNGIDDIRLTLRGIKPIEEELGINRLKLQMERLLKESSIKGYVNFNGDLGKINYTKWKIIIENTREALTNTLKYSNCRSFWINIDVMNKMIKIELKDDGMGEKKVIKGMGLKGMEQRCEEIGGKLIINGDYGFVIIMLLPI